MKIRNYLVSLSIGIMPIGLAAPIEPAQLPRSVINPEPPQAPIYSKLMMSPTAAVTSADKQVTVKAASSIKFHLNQVVVVGSSVYSAEQLRALYNDKLGKNISFSELQAIVDSITQKYRKDGYILSRAMLPVQQVKNGKVTVQVLEGYIAKAKVSGQAKGADKLLQAYGNRLVNAKRPLEAKALERYALLADDIPGIKVKTVIGLAANQTANTPGATDLTFAASQNPATGYISYDNRGTRYLGPYQYSLGGQLNSLLRSGDQFGIQGLVTDNIQALQYFKAYTQQPLGSNGALLTLEAAYSRAKPGYTLEILNLLGESKDVGIELAYPLLLSRLDNITLKTNFDWLDNRNDAGEPFNSNIYHDRLRSIRLSAVYQGIDHWLGQNQIELQVSKGLKIWGAGHQQYLSRQDGRNDYRKITFNIARQQALPANFSVAASAKAQYALDPLLSSEEFSYGGGQFGRAYDPSEISGDRGIAGSLEARYNSYPNKWFLQAAQYYTFYDIGKIWNIGTLGGQLSAASGSSAGLGIRATINRRWAWALEAAKPLTRPVNVANNNSIRVFFNIHLLFDAPQPEQIPSRIYRAPIAGHLPVS